MFCHFAEPYMRVRVQAPPAQRRCNVARSEVKVAHRSRAARERALMQKHLAKVAAATALQLSW